MESYASTTLFASAFALHALLAFAQGPPGPPGVCNVGAVFICYREYSSVLFRPELLPNADGSFNDTSYLSACSFFAPDSACQLSIAHCPKPFRDQFARSEEGYKATRAVVCDAPSLQALVRISSCLNNDRMHKCVDNPTKPEDGSNPREYWCTFTQGSLRCVDEGVKECKHSYEQEKPIFRKYFAAVSNMFLCDAIASGSAAVVAPQVFVFGALGLMLTGWATTKS
uniref:24 kDa family member n=1 Tax=Rhipicephalus appendiculatus TaxID=34631 RepID=A0A131YQU7_RHIAP